MDTKWRTALIQGALFVATLITTTLAGAELTYGKSIFAEGYTWHDFTSGFMFSIPFLLILTVHEFGHYFTARYHRVSSSLPYYIPVPPIPFVPVSIGTLGAVIRLRQQVHSKKHNFDIGIAGPLAGFVMALVVLFYGFTHLPEPEYIFQIHPEYEQYGLHYADKVYEPQDTPVLDVGVGNNLVFMFFEHFVADPARMPNPHEVMHYPLVFAGYLALFFTFLNLLPIGQLDGGHVVYGLLGYKRHRIIATVFFIAFAFYAGLGYLNPTDYPDESLMFVLPVAAFLIYSAFLGLGLSKRDTLMYAMVMLAVLFALARLVPDLKGYSGYVFFAFILGRFIGVRHPPSEIEEPLDTKRVVLGWLAIAIFIGCFTPAPLEIYVLVKGAVG